MRKSLGELLSEASVECTGIDGKIVPPMCFNCSNGELHGFPRCEVPDWYVFSVSFYCPIGKHHDPSGEACEEYSYGEPRKVRDDADGF